MGSGKTTYMTKLMNEAHTQALGKSFTDPSHEPVRFLYVAPLLTEVDRISTACPDLNFRNPQPVEGRKLHHLSTLIDEGANICTTHALFRLLNRDICRKLMEQNYTLVIDEVLDCVTMFEELSASDRKLLFRDHLVYIDPDTKRLRWNHRDHPTYAGKFNTVRDLCDNGNLVLYRDTALIWEFPTDFLRCFDQTYVLTYMFYGSPMSAYLRAEGLPYVMRTLVDHQLVSWADHSDETETKEKLRNLISVYDGPSNRWGEAKGRENPMSSGWYDNLLKSSPHKLPQIKASLEHWYKMIARTPSDANAWTAFTKVKKHLRGVRYAKGWIPNNTKATNVHRHKASLAYLLQRLPQSNDQGLL